MAGIYSVSQVNAYLGSMFREDYLLRRIRIRGEASNVKYHSSGHVFFTLKDEGASIQAVVFSGRRQGLPFRLSDGQRVVAEGSVEVYEKGGSYRLSAFSVAEDGRGDLFQAFLKLKKELEEMGMFAPEYKKPIPAWCFKVGIVTAETGAAIRDIVNVSTRRNPYVQLVLCPAKVQGEGAAESICRGIEILDRYGVDVIIAGRGGGSIEDLWAFNEELVARAIFSCGTPVISAVGHETDFTIADFAADLRAPTPSAAAELAVADISRLFADLDSASRRLSDLFAGRIADRRQALKQMELRLKLRSPGRMISEKRSVSSDLALRMEHLFHERFKETKHRFLRDAERLELLSPLKRLTGGFAYVTDEEGKAVREAAGLETGDKVRLRFKDGDVGAEIL